MKNKTSPHALSPSVTKASAFTSRHPSSRSSLILAVSAAALLFVNAPSTHAETWALTTGGSWATPANWTPATVTNAVGAVAQFSAINTANRTITNDSGAAGFTVGFLSFDLTGTGTFTNSLTTGTAGSNLKLDNGGAGVAITTTGNGTGNNTISVPTVFNDSVTANVNQTTSSSASGSLNLTANITGIGGFTKQGDGLVTLGTGAKTYGGATVLNGGRTRISNAAQPSQTSSFTVNAGAQLTLTATSGIFTFGSGSLNLNGFGATSGPFAAFPGAIRNDTNYVATINNPVVLQSDTLLHVEGSATGSITFTNSITGPGGLTLTAPGSGANQGQLVLNAINSYLGGTFVNGGTIVLSGTSASLGFGNVTVDDFLSAAIAKLTIQSAVLDAIADTATLTLAGGGTAALADENYLELQGGVNETIAGLVLGGVVQGAGTYGSNTSAATFKSNEYFSGTGMVTVVPEPGAAVMVLGGLGLLLGLRRRHGV